MGFFSLGMFGHKQEEEQPHMTVFTGLSLIRESKDENVSGRRHKNKSIYESSAGRTRHFTPGRRKRLLLN